MSKTAREALHAAIVKASAAMPPFFFAHNEHGAEYLIDELAESGFVIAPKEPTEEMLDAPSKAGVMAGDYRMNSDEASAAWSAMIAASQDSKP